MKVGIITTDKLPTVDLRILELMALQQVYDDNPRITNQAAAKMLGMTERNLYRKLKKYRIEGTIKYHAEKPTI